MFLAIHSKASGMDDEDEFDDEFGDIDDTELLAAATQVESRILGGNLTGSSNQTEHPLDGFDSHNTSFTSFDDLDDLELPTPAPPRRISGSFRQSTLLGGPLRKENERPQNLNRTSQGTPTLNSTAAATMTKHNWRLVDSQEPPTHHRIDKGSAKTWVYPTNLGHRDYQYNIVHRALLNNLLVALPTGAYI